MKITRRQLRRIIETVLLEGEVVDFEKERMIRRQVADIPEREPEREEIVTAVSGDSSEDWIYDIEGDIESMMQGIESGQVVDLASEDPFDYDYVSEAKAYAGTMGMGIDVPGKSDAGEAPDACQVLRDEIENVTHQYDTEKDQQQKKAYGDQLRSVSATHFHQCGPQ